MADNQLTPEQLQALVQYASKRLGTTPEKLQRTVQQGNVEEITSGLPQDNVQRLKEVLSDKKKAEALLQSPQAQKLMQQLGLNKKK